MRTFTQWWEDIKGILAYPEARSIVEIGWDGAMSEQAKASARQLYVECPYCRGGGCYLCHPVHVIPLEAVADVEKARRDWDEKSRLTPQTQSSQSASTI